MNIDLGIADQVPSDDATTYLCSSVSNSDSVPTGPVAMAVSSPYHSNFELQHMT